MRWCLCLFVLIASPVSAAEQVVLEVRYLSTSDATFKTLGLEPTSQVAPAPEEGEVLLDRAQFDSAEQGIRLVSAVAVTEHRPLISHQILSPEQAAKLLRFTQADPQSNAILGPKIVVQPGDTGHVQSMTKRPFVVDLKGDQTPKSPVVRELNDGTAIALRPDLFDQETIDLALRFDMSNVSDVQAIAKSPSDPSAKIQVPETTALRVELAARLKSGETLAVWGDSLSTIREGKVKKRGLLGLGKPRVVGIGREHIPLVLLVTPTIVSDALQTAPTSDE